MTNRETAEELVEEFPDDLDATVEAVEEDLDRLINEFDVPEDEAIRSVKNTYRDEYDGEGNFDSPSTAQDDEYDIGDLTAEHDEEWMTVSGTVQQLFSLSDNQATWIAQRGVIGDNTGTTVFTVPKDVVNEDPSLELEVGETYELQGVVGDAYQGNIGIKLNSNTTGTTLDETFDPPSSGNDGNEDVSIGDLTPAHDDEWMTIRGTVQRHLELNERQKEWIAQRGVIGDDTGTTVYTIPSDLVESNPEFDLEVGGTYQLDSVVGDAHQNRIGVRAVSTSEVTTLDESFDPPENDTRIMGPIVDIQQGSGLIKRCPEDDCNRALNDDRCGIHGQVDGEFDLRLKVVMDDGNQVHEVFFGTEATEALTGISLEQAVEIAEDAMQIEAVKKEMEPMLLGRYYSIVGDNAGEYVIVQKFTRVERDDWDEEAQRLLDTLPSRDVTSEDPDVAA